MQKTDYIETIEIAVESFNQLGIANIRYAPMDMGTLPGNCPLDTMYLKEKFQNQLLFTRNYNESADEWGCGTRASLLYSKSVKDFFGYPPAKSNLNLPAFSSIICSSESKYFLRYGVGVVLHEINHLFGIKHTHFSANNTNGILNINIPEPDIDDTYYDDTMSWDEKLEKMQRFINIYPFGDTLLATQYTLTSPFSLQHYHAQDLVPYLSFNSTRMEEILDSYNTSASQKNDYFYLLNKYAGYPVVRTYQDVLGLAKAVYYIAPDSLAGQTFDFRSYYLVEGIYIASQDQQKLVQLIEYLHGREEFNYPILAQEKLSLTSYRNNNFSASLYEHFKIVSLSPGLITCHLLPAYNATLSLTLDSDCWLKVNSNVTGIFSFQVRIANNVTRLQRKVTLRVIEKIPVKNRVLLSNPQAQYVLLNNATSINLIKLCQAVAVPRGKILNCSWTTSFANNSLDNCYAELNNRTEDYNLSVIFTQAEARKTCHIQVLNLRNSTSMEEYPIAQALLSKPEYPLWAAADQAIVDSAFFKNLQQCSQLLTIPLLQGIFEGIIDPCHIADTYKTLLKFIPRITLLALGFTSFLSAGMAMLASIFTDFMREKLANNISSKLENCIQLLFFIIVTELEYAPSNLWQLSGQLEIFPESIALLNKLIVQMALAPALKTGAYLTSQGLMQYLMSPAEKVDNPKQQSSTADFFSAFNVACNTVFSRKICRPFTFFSRPAANNRFIQRVENLGVNSFLR